MRGLLIILVAAFTAMADTHDTIETSCDTIAGDLPSIVKNTGKPYLVTADITVPPGMSVVIESGTRLLFKNFSGLQVYGTLLARGTAERPIIFTSENDRARGSSSATEPAPYDWNGITVTENAVGTSFEYCQVSYSLYGINDLAADIALRKCMFFQNGKSDFVYKGVKQTVLPGPFTFLPLGEKPAAAVAAVAPPPARKRSGVKIGLQAAGIAALAAGLGVGLWKFTDYRTSSATFDGLSPDANAQNRYTVTSAQWDAAHRNRTNDLYAMGAGFGFALLGAVAITISLF
jgi:hypothetical protein